MSTHSLRLIFQLTCPDCFGSGKSREDGPFQSPTAGKPDCGCCHGRKVVPTELGEDFLRFFEDIVLPQYGLRQPAPPERGGEGK